jgi:hypothetical protein
MSRVFNFQNQSNPYGTVFLNFLDRSGNVNVQAIRNDGEDTDEVDISYLFRCKNPKISYPYGGGIHFCNYHLKSKSPDMMVFELNQKEVTYQGKTYLMYDYPSAAFVTAMQNNRMGLVCVSSIMVHRKGVVDLYRFGNIQAPNIPLVMSSETDDTVQGQAPYNFRIIFNEESFNKMPDNLVNYFLNPENSLIVERVNTDSVFGNSFRPVVAFYPAFGKGDGDYMSFHVVTGEEVFALDLDPRAENLCSGVSISSAYSDEQVISEESISKARPYDVLIG